MHFYSKCLQVMSVHWKRSVLIKQISKTWKFSRTTYYNSSSNWRESKGTTNEIPYPRMIKALDRILYLIGNQGIFSRGTQKTAVNSDILWNPGSFLAIVWQVTHCYLLLYEHIYLPLLKDVSYMSPASQNELIAIAAKYIVQKWLFLQTKVLVYTCMCIYVRR